MDPWFTLHQGNCLDIMPTLDAGSVDMVLADPPYGTTACKWDSVLPFDKMWAGIKHATKRNAAVVMTASQPFTSALVMSNPKMFKHEWVWEKNRGSNFLNTKREPMKEHELVVVFSEGAWTYNPQMQERKGSGKTLIGKTIIGARTPTSTNNGGVSPRSIVLPEMRVPSSVQRFVTACGKDKIHPTQKPVALMEYLIRTYTNPGDTVLDFTMGSGTTGMACMNTGRNFIGIELDPGYFEIAKRRIESAAA